MKMSFNCFWNQPISESILHGNDGMVASLLRGDAIAFRMDGIDYESARTMSKEMETEVTGAQRTHRSSWKEWNKPGAIDHKEPSGHPQLTSMMAIPNDPTTNRLWDGICRTLHGFSDAITGVTIVGNAIPKTKRKYATPAHYHAPPVINVAIYGKCIKEYILVKWTDATHSMQKNDKHITESEMLACLHTTHRIGVDPSLPNVIIFPPRTFHLIKTVNDTPNPELYLGFGTYFLFSDNDFIDSAVHALKEAMQYPNWYNQLDKTDYASAVKLAERMAENWLSYKKIDMKKRVKQTSRPSLTAPSNYFNQIVAQAVAASAEAFVTDARNAAKRTSTTAEVKAPAKQKMSDKVAASGSAASGSAASGSAASGSAASGSAASGKRKAAQEKFGSEKRQELTRICFVCASDLSNPATFSTKCTKCNLMACKKCAGFIDDAHFQRYKKSRAKEWLCSNHGRLSHCFKCSDVITSCEESTPEKVDVKNSLGCEFEISPGVYCENWVCTIKCANKAWDFDGTWYCDEHSK